MNKLFTLIFILCIAVPTIAKEQEKTFSRPCGEVWDAVKATASTGQYRILSVDKEDQIISFAAGGFWGGVRELSAHLHQGEGKSCTVTVQSRFTGLVHHDAPAFLKRIEEHLKN
jgi:hypothetical protein